MTAPYNIHFLQNSEDSLWIINEKDLTWGQLRELFCSRIKQGNFCIQENNFYIAMYPAMLGR